MSSAGIINVTNCLVTFIHFDVVAVFISVCEVAIAGITF